MEKKEREKERGKVSVNNGELGTEVVNRTTDSQRE